MFGKLTRHDNVSSEKNITEETGSPEMRILESIMRFTGASSLEELEEIVKGAEDLSAKEQAKENQLIFGAVNTIKNNRSLDEAKEMEKNEDFINAVLAGFSAEKAYALANIEKLTEEAFAEGERQGKLNASIKKDRVGEEGITVTGGYKAEIDPANMTMEDLRKIKERLRKGESVRL